MEARFELAPKGEGNPKSVLAGGFGRLNEALKLSDLGPHCVADRFGLVRVEPALKIAVAIAPRATRALGPAVHSAPVPTSYSRLQTWPASTGLRTTPVGLSQIRQPALYISLTYGVVWHFLAS